MHQKIPQKAKESAKEMPRKVKENPQKAPVMVCLDTPLL